MIAKKAEYCLLVRYNQLVHVVTFHASRYVKSNYALVVIRALHYFHTEGGATFTRLQSEAPLLSYTMAFRCASDDSDNELTPMKEEIIQPYARAPLNANQEYH